MGPFVGPIPDYQLQACPRTAILGHSQPFSEIALSFPAAGPIIRDEFCSARIGRIGSLDAPKLAWLGADSGNAPAVGCLHLPLFHFGRQQHNHRRRRPRAAIGRCRQLPYRFSGTRPLSTVSARQPQRTCPVRTRNQGTGWVSSRPLCHFAVWIALHWFEHSL
jgi:hypothetical protein